MWLLPMPGSPDNSSTWPSPSWLSLAHSRRAAAVDHPSIDLDQVDGPRLRPGTANLDFLPWNWTPASAKLAA
jgi:hypothetical protein